MLLATLTSVRLVATSCDKSRIQIGEVEGRQEQEVKQHTWWSTGQHPTKEMELAGRVLQEAPKGKNTLIIFSSHVKKYWKHLC